MPFEEIINRADTKYKIQNTEYRIQNTEYKVLKMLKRADIGGAKTL